MSEQSEQTEQAERRYEVVVVGGGAAGVSGAMTLARARRSVLVIDAGQPRNAPAEGVHNYLGREGTPPGELLAIGREEARRYGAAFREGSVAAVGRLDDGEGFRVALADGGAVLADRLLVTTGLVDELPEVPGLAGLWGRDVLHCPYCHGWEVRDRFIGVLASGPWAAHQALMWRQWSERVTLFRHTAPELGEEERERLAARGIAVVEGEVTAVETGEDGRLSGVRLAGSAAGSAAGSGAGSEGRLIPCDALVVATRMTARAGVLASLGLKPVDVEMGGHVIGSRVDADALTGATAVPGVWVAGNVANPMDHVIGSAATGVRAAAAINGDLIEAETRRAVAAR
jgi:thioredoxin reductase